jgi:stage III sporulation protein AE
MKKFVFFIITILLLLPTFSTVSAQETGEIDGAINDILGGISDSDFNNISQILNENFNENKTIKEWIVLFLTGEVKFDVTMLLSLIKSSFSGVVDKVYKILLYVIFIGITFGIFNVINCKKSGNSEKNIIYFISYSLVVVLASQIVSSVFYSARQEISDMSKTIDGCFPLLITLSDFSGGFGTAFIKPLTGVVSILSSVLCGNVLLPLLSTCLISVVIGNISSTIKLDALKKSILSLVKWILGIVTLVFSVVITAQGIVNSQYNGMSFKILKYATGSIIPIVGGFISGGLDVILSSAVLVKNSFGLILVFYVLFSVISSGASILIVSFLIKFVVSICEPLLDGNVVKLLSGIGEVFSYLTAVILVCGFSYVLVCFSIINSTALII